ncbi:MAG TPA: RluA family pseudouridine synthase [Candidatus Acidoferrales bacterium]|nr:RluA family pseudouridine synthase [Candidatus Acidoferrales bacterium]
MNEVVKLSSAATHEFWEIPVLHEDAELLALEKPAGLLTSPDRQAPERPSLMRLLHEGLAAGKPWARARNLSYLANAHRLDFETSGALLLAKSKAALVALADQFGSDRPLRKYVALAQGVPPDDAFVVAEKIGPHPLQSGRMRIDSRQGKKARTEFAVLETFSRWSLLRCVPRMERPQQIALHLGHARFALVGDEAHGGKKLWLSRLKRDFRLKPGREERPLISRPLLHAEEVTVLHPVTGETVRIQSEWPKDLRVALKYLRLYAKPGSVEVPSGERGERNGW